MIIMLYGSIDGSPERLAEIDVEALVRLFNPD
jgi:hypothetical protein